MPTKPLVFPASSTISGVLRHAICIVAGIGEGVIVKIGGWRTRNVFER
jgi:hypothetical protein